MTIRDFKKKYGISNKVAYECTFGIRMKPDEESHHKAGYTENDLYRNLMDILQKRLDRKSKEYHAVQQKLIEVKYIHATGGQHERTV